MDGSPMIQENAEDKAARREKCLEYIPRLQQFVADKCPMSDTAAKDLDLSIRAYRVLILAGVKKVSDICTADFSGAADLLSIGVIDEIRDSVLSDCLKTTGSKAGDHPETEA